MGRLRETGVPSRWHPPQTKGTFSGATADRGSFTGTMSWFPWQLTQRGASGSPRAIALPWSDRAYCSCSVVVARATLYRRRLFVREILSFQVGVAARAPQAAMDGSREFLPVHVQRNRFAGSRRAHGSCRRGRRDIPRPAGRRRGRGGRKQQRDNYGEQRRECNSHDRRTTSFA